MTTKKLSRQKSRCTYGCWGVCGAVEGGLLIVKLAVD